MRIWSIVEDWCNSDASGDFGTILQSSLVSGVNHENGRFGQLFRDPSSSSSSVHVHEDAHALEAISAFYDGQTEAPFMDDQSTDGLFGGYKVYDHEICMRYCSTPFATKCFFKTLFIISGNFLSRKPRFVAFNLETGKLEILWFHQHEFYVVNVNQKDGTMQEEHNVPPPHDIGLLWMENYVRILHTNQMSGRLKSVYTCTLYYKYTCS